MNSAPASPADTPSAGAGRPAAQLQDALAITAVEDTGRLPQLVHTVTLAQPRDQVRRAGLLATAHGLYEMRIGGAPATESVLNPGWTTYERRLQVQRLDVTAQVRQRPEGLAAADADRLDLEATLADGWWRGDLGFDG